MVNAAELNYGMCFRNHPGATSLAPHPSAEPGWAFTVWRSRRDRRAGSPGVTGTRRGQRVPYPRAQVLDLEPVGFDLLLEDVVLSYLLLQL